MKDCFEIAKKLQSAPEPSPCNGRSCLHVSLVCVALAAESFQPHTHEHAHSRNTDASEIDNAYNEVGGYEKRSSNPQTAHAKGYPVISGVRQSSRTQVLAENVELRQMIANLRSTVAVSIAATWQAPLVCPQNFLHLIGGARSEI